MRTILAAIAIVAACADPELPAEPIRRVLGEHDVGRYTIRLLDHMEGDECYSPPRLEIRRDETLVYADTAERGFVLGNCAAEDESFPPGRDLTGDGGSNLLISRIGGGAKPQVAYLLFEIGPRFRLVTELDTGYARARFVDLDRDGVPEVITEEYHPYWPNCFAGSPHPTVILRFDDGAYVLAPDLMRRPRRQFADLRERAAAVKDAGWERWWAAPPELWQYPVDLMYAGQAELAWRFVDLAWPAGAPEKQDFLLTLKSAIARSHYSEAIWAMND